MNHHHHRSALILFGALLVSCAPQATPAPSPTEEAVAASSPADAPEPERRSTASDTAPADTVDDPRPRGVVTPEELEEARREREAQREAERPEPEPEPEPSPAEETTDALAHLPPPAAEPRMPEARPTGAVLPDRRIVAFYGHPGSQRMGILGEVPPDDMLRRLDTEVAAWERADPDTPVQPALHLIATVAAADAGADGLYRNLTSTTFIERVMEWADRRNAIVFLDIQPGFSTYEAELERLMPYLEQPHVHLGIDPEFDMPEGRPPGSRVGTTDARQVNRLIDILSELVREHDLPPKVLVVHRFTQRMVTNANDIRPTDEVQVVMHMDGWGPPSQKISTYRDIVAPEPVEYLGFKVFYRNDRRSGGRIMTPEEILRLEPVPMYIHYH